MIRVALLSALFILTSLVPHGVTLAADDGKRITVGIVPQQSATRLAILWTPILRHLSEQTGYTLEFKTARDIPTFEQRLAAGEYDVAYMNPYHYTVFGRDPGYRAFAAEKDRMLTGIVVIPKDKEYQELAELNGKTIALPAPAAFAASVLVHAMFTDAGVNVEPKYVASHDSVYRAVVQGLYPAGGGVMRTYNNLDAEIRDQLKIAWKTKSYTPHPFAAHPRVPREVVERIAQAMLAMDQSEAGRSLLATIDFKGLRTVKDSEYDGVRALRIGVLKTAKP
jgi:phosphonate transport system substrate-binding protein